MRCSSETFSESNAKLGNEPMVKKICKYWKWRCIMSMWKKSENELKLRTEELNQRKIEFEGNSG